MYHPRFRCPCCGRIYETALMARLCEQGDYREMIRTPPHGSTIAGSHSYRSQLMMIDRLDYGADNR